MREIKERPAEQAAPLNNRDSSDKFRKGFVAFVLIVIALSYLVDFLMQWYARTILAEMAQTPIAEVEFIDIFSDSTEARLARVSDPVIMTEFFSCLDSLEDYSPNHPSYSASVLVRPHIKSMRGMDFKLNLRDPPDGVAYVYVTRRSDFGSISAYAMYGTHKSRCLYKWLVKTNALAETTVPPQPIRDGEDSAQ